jgi:predicted nucleic acid-binding protein
VTANTVLVDTSVWILALKRNPDTVAKTRVSQLMSHNRIAIIPLIYIELLGGVNTEAEFQHLKNRLNSLRQIQLVKNDWEEVAHNAFKLRRKGITIPYIDIIISTAASLNKLILLHADKHFELIAGEIHLETESMLA